MGNVVVLNVENKRKGITTKIERDELFCRLIDYLMQYDLKDVADESGISKSTLNNWVYGTTQSPQLRTIMAVAEVIHLEVKLVEVGSEAVSTQAVKKKEHKREQKKAAIH